MATKRTLATGIATITLGLGACQEEKAYQESLPRPSLVLNNYKMRHASGEISKQREFYHDGERVLLRAFQYDSGDRCLSVFEGISGRESLRPPIIIYQDVDGASGFEGSLRLSTSTDPHYSQEELSKFFNQTMDHGRSIRLND